MVPNKFEQHIKEQLGEREIQPSSKAWERISERLNEITIERSQRRGYFWYALAACIVGLLIVSWVVLNTSISSSAIDSQVVEDETKINDEINDFQKVEIQENADEIVVTKQIYKANKNTEVKKVEDHPEKEAGIDQLSDAAKKVQIPEDSSEKFINLKIIEVIAQVDALEQNQEQLTDAEVDSLLRKAQEEILKDKLFRSDRSIDALALLTEVEDELDQSFRDQIFESLKAGFLKVRTAVAERNN